MSWIGNFCRALAVAALGLTTLQTGSCAAVDTEMERHNLGGYIDFQVSGGFAGARLGLSINDDGQAVARDERRGIEAREQLDFAQLARIRKAFASIASDGEHSVPGLSRCADCIHYSVKATIDGVRYRTTMAVGNQETSPYRDVVTLLSTILHETLSRAAKTGS